MFLSNSFPSPFLHSPRSFIISGKLSPRFSCGAGLGITLLSDTVVRMSDHDEPVVFYKLDSDDVSRNIAVMWKKKRYVSKAMKEFTKLAVEMFSG